MKDQLKNNLTQLVKQLLSYQDLKEGKAICDKIYRLMIEAFDFDMEQGDTVKTHYGKALDPRSTAMTLMLPVRNRRFLEAMLKVLDDDKTVLYLGSGPFAPFFLFSVLLGYKAKFTLIEISDYSLELFEKVRERFQLSDYLLEVVKADAALWQADRQYDIVIGGVNDMGMRYEDSFYIHKNIFNQLPNAIHVPKDIHLYLKKDEQIDYYDSLLNGIGRGALRDDCPYTKEERPILMTKVLVDDDLVLEPEESVITGSTYFYS